MPLKMEYYLPHKTALTDIIATARHWSSFYNDQNSF